jgi:hypothetical protein
MCINLGPDVSSWSTTMAKSETACGQPSPMSGRLANGLWMVCGEPNALGVCIVLTVSSPHRAELA